MAEAKLFISGGDVLDVQLTSETVVIETPMGRRPSGEPGHITNRMRLFVREDGAKEQVYDFEDTELGVRETQRVAIVRAQAKLDPEPVNLILFNLSSGQHDTFESAIRAYLARKTWFGPGVKAFLAALVLGAVFWAVSRFVYQRTEISADFIAIGFALVLFPALWWLIALWERLRESARYKAARAHFITEMSARVQRFASQAEGGAH